jgi:hypothetical protein
VKAAAAPAEVSEVEPVVAAKAAAPAETAGLKEATKLQLNSDPNCNSFECFTHHTLWEKEADPVQYPISSEKTLDDDIRSTQTHIAQSEKKLGKWTWTGEHNVFAQMEEAENIKVGHPTRKTEFKNWPQHRHHFENNYKNWPAKNRQRSGLMKKMENNWGTNQY